jgi:hypothetical protein
LSKRPDQYGWPIEALSLAGHLAYGITMESVRRRIRDAL